MRDTVGAMEAYETSIRAGKYAQIKGGQGCEAESTWEHGNGLPEFRWPCGDSLFGRAPTLTAHGIIDLAIASEH
jgi:hypothetical protein